MVDALASAPADPWPLGFTEAASDDHVASKTQE